MRNDVQNNQYNAQNNQQSNGSFHLDITTLYLLPVKTDEPTNDSNTPNDPTNSRIKTLVLNWKRCNKDEPNYKREGAKKSSFIHIFSNLDTQKTGNFPAFLYL